VIFYASGTFIAPRIQEAIVRHKIAFLTSFAYRTAMWQQLPTLASRLRAAGVRVHFMLDSGAFTAWSLGKEIAIDSLIDACNRVQDEYSDCLDVTFVSLDRLPGRKGTKPTPAELTSAVEESVRNYEVMAKRVRGYVKPVFHLGDADWAADYYAKRINYIGLGASRDQPYEVRRKWAADMGIRFAGKKLHGLAMTGTRMLRTVAWHSVDSAAWVQWAGFGAIAWVRPNGALVTIPVSQESPRVKDIDGHLSTLAEPLRDRIIAELHSMGTTELEVRESSEARAIVNIVMFQRACDLATTKGTVTEGREGLFNA
jgi:hypothetical protein